MFDLIVMNDQWRRFGVRVVRLGDGYGLDDRLTHDRAEPMIEFYDLTPLESGDDRFGPRGQFVSRYNIETLARDLASRPGFGLNLDGGVDAWKIDRDALRNVHRLVHAVRTREGSNWL